MSRECLGERLKRPGHCIEESERKNLQMIELIDPMFEIK